MTLTHQVIVYSKHTIPTKSHLITTVPKSVFSVNSAWGTDGNVDLSKYRDSYSEWYYYNDDWPSLRKILHFKKNEQKVYEKTIF